MKIRTLVFAWLISLGLSAQEKTMAVNVSVFNEDTAIPFTRFWTAPVHPGIQLGTEFNLKSKTVPGFIKPPTPATFTIIAEPEISNGIAQRTNQSVACR